MLFQKLRRLLVGIAVKYSDEQLLEKQVKIQYGEHILDVKSITYPEYLSDGNDPVIIEVERYYGGRWESDMVNARPGGTV